jgi:prepilin-type N-terminal cleavage/methylation domain-containing protein
MISFANINLFRSYIQTAGINTMKSNQSGFSLVEILVTIAIVGVLAAIAIPAYQNYRLTASLAEAFLVLDEERIKIEVYYETHGRMPVNGNDAGITAYPNVGLVTQLRWNAGIPGIPSSDALHVGTFSPGMDLREFGNQYGAYNATFHFIGRGDQSGRIEWECVADEMSSDALAQDILPASCN